MATPAGALGTLAVPRPLAQPNCQVITISGQAVRSRLMSWPSGISRPDAVAVLPNCRTSVYCCGAIAGSSVCRESRYRREETAGKVLPKRKTSWPNMGQSRLAVNCRCLMPIFRDDYRRKTDKRQKHWICSILILTIQQYVISLSVNLHLRLFLGCAFF